MHTYTKIYIDNLMKRSMYDAFEVSMEKLTAEAVANFKLSLIKNKDNIPKEEDIDDEPAEKKQKLDTNGIDVLNMVLSRVSETHTFESQFNSSLKPIKETASTSIEEVPTIIDCDESTKFANASAKNVWPRINVIDARKIMEPDRFIEWMKILHLDIKPKRLRNRKTDLAVAEPSTSKLNPSLHSTKVNKHEYPLNAINNVEMNFNEIEKIYKKYFGRSVLDTIIITANILNIMAISNKHHKERMDASFNKTSEAENFKERCRANFIHLIHKKILESKLKTNFVQIISYFDESEFDSAFKMLFLSILTVLRVLDQPKHKKSHLFNNLTLLLSTSLKNCAHNHPKMFLMFQSNTFRPECIELIGLIEERRDIDPGVIFRMPLFFISTVDSKQFFQGATDIVTGKFNEKLELSIDNAIRQCSNYSKFKDSVDSSTVEHSNLKVPAAETIQSPIKSEKIVHTTYQFKNKNGTFRLILLLNGNKSQTIGNAGAQPSMVTSQPLNNFSDPISSSQQKITSESSNSTTIQTKKCTVAMPTIPNSPLSSHQTTSSSEAATSVPSKRTLLTPNTSIKNIQSEPNSSPRITQGNTIVIGNKLYKIVRVPPSTTRQVDTNSPQKQPSTDFIKCFVHKCKKPATIMCSKCTTAKYCSLTCQQRHWHSNHVTECDNMIRQSQALA